MNPRTHPEIVPAVTKWKVSATERILADLQLFGYRPGLGEVDDRPAPEPEELEGAIAEIFDGLHSTLADSRLEPDLADLLWSLVNVFHRAIDRVQRALEINEDAQKSSQKLQDGSEIRSVELESLLLQGALLLDRRDSMEFMRDAAAQRYEQLTGSAWRPQSGSVVNRRALTAAMIESRDFVAARRRAETDVMFPAGARIAFTGGPNFNDHRQIWDVLDKVRAKHSEMVLLHGGTPTGAERIAARWAETRNVPQVVFRPNWAQHAKAAPFKRNDQLLAALPIGVIGFPGSGISANLLDKARKQGIPVRAYEAKEA